MTKAKDGGGMAGDVLVLFTMDVEPAAQADGKTSGPATLAEGARRVREYAEVLGEFGYSPTYFVHPELGETQADLFAELQSRGACVGLHIHAVKFATVPSPCELGGLTGARQESVIAAGAEMFSRHFGFQPRIFRPGCFSANDETYRVLCRLGFEGGSISIPGRVWPDRCCIWTGADPHPHYAHEAFRQSAGQLPFVEIPLSVDRVGGLRRHPLGFDHYVDLRPGGVYRDAEDSGRDHSVIVRHLVEQLVAEAPRLKTLVIDVHNDRDFADLSTTPARQLRTVLESLAPELSQHGLRPVNATFETAIERFKGSAY